jgi:ferredoxin
VPLTLRVDTRRCFKSGECYYNHPALLAAGDDGFPRPLLPSLESEPLRHEAQQAVEVCPSQALSLVDAG